MQGEIGSSKDLNSPSPFKNFFKREVKSSPVISSQASHANSLHV
ncbi:Uncharacterised protein [Acinetobacter baumannii ATCC 17978]|nr:Uncharacterised protein [Acinetobacter baumannii ATCC 17978]